MIYHTYPKLRKLLRDKGITKGQVAKKLNVGIHTISRRLNEGYSWKSDEMYTILKILDQPPEMLHIIFPEDGGRVK